MLQNGAKVCLSDIDEIKGNETKILYQKQFGLNDNGVCFVKCDVAVKEAWSELWNTAEKLLEGPIEILVNNAGLNHTVSFFYLQILSHGLLLSACYKCTLY